ncbi:MAG TPA: R3H domain-containing nucleic acid-binding protein [Bryobacteraceae bacterium]|nr:R3H domain-containing nucleic acid-binding protein [Bryobacteraceae bacterium]
MPSRKFTVENTGARIEPFLRKLIEHAGFRLEFEVRDGSNLHPDFENPDLIVSFRGPDVEYLLANKAELLLALEQLSMEMLKLQPDEHSLVQFDANNFRTLRIEELRMSALLAAEKVKRTKVPYEFSPMTSRERRIIHLALRGETDVRSESGGMGPGRKVIVYPADMPAKPSSPTPLRRGRR